ncbi:MAG: glycoside hydrolase family 3 C-terminal domain-containing protein [Solobacterium sp.]|jgi:beta-glucosidase|nr:glycoside hydrolase family 3 C-terminal domain-containing protein [Solobacterium sp.]
MNYYGAVTADVSQREIKNAALSRAAAEEGFVLLKNEQVLPLQTRKIALFGMGARKTTAFGEGSGSVAPRYTVSVEQGLKNAGCDIVSAAWLDDYDREFDETYEAYRQMVEEKIAGIANPIAQIPEAHKYKYRYPSGRLINEADTADHGAAAVYVLMRQAGECTDRKNEPGDFQLTQIEKDNLSFLADHYDSLTLVINVGGLIDLSILDEVKGIGAVVYIGQPGMEAGNAVAEVLLGQNNFSGKLADSWPNNYSEIPNGDTFSYMNGNLDQEFYSEGMYVGYRYYDAFRKQPRFPFGYGLSYTSFQLNVKEVVLNEDEVLASVSVSNTGNIYAGKEVVQMYLSVPGDTVRRSLCAFTKTDLIQTGCSAAVQLSFHLNGQAVYDESKAAWVLPAGDYVISIGSDSASAEDTAIITVHDTVIVRQCRNACVPTSPLDEMKAPKTNPSVCSKDLPRLDLDSSAIKPEVAVYEVPDAAVSSHCREVIDQLSEDDLIELVRGGDVQKEVPGQLLILGAGGKTAITLLDKGIFNIAISDGPAGINIMPEVIYRPDGSQKTARMPEKYNWGKMRMMAGRLVGHEGVHVYRYATAWPTDSLMANTWNTQLLEQVGKAIGDEMNEFGITLWLAPAMNIHRNPLCGRNFEYYSEDPLVSGKMAAALTRGVQSHPGIGTVIKHFCCNNQEDNRAYVDSVVSERTLRELYLKGFEIALKEGNPKSLMTSYNKLNGIYSGNRPDLMTDIVRCEWGYQGLTMTDWDTRYNAAVSIHAGVDLTMPGSAQDAQQVHEAHDSHTLDEAGLKRSAARVLDLILNSQTAAQN